MTQKNGLRVCEILDQSGPVLQRNGTFQLIFARSALIEKSSELLSLIGSLLYTHFPLSIR